jgi:DNA-binding Lrp family transcriptional regulator
MTVIDEVNERILQELIRDGRISNLELADRVGLSPSACLRRVQDLERRGVIAGYRAVLDRAALGVGFTAYVTVGLNSHTKASQEESDSVDRQAGATRVRMSLDNMAATYGGVKSLATAVRDALINYSGTSEGVTINSIRETMHADLGENLEPGGDGAVYRVITDFIIWHE